MERYRCSSCPLTESLSPLDAASPMDARPLGDARFQVGTYGGIPLANGIPFQKSSTPPYDDDGITDPLNKAAIASIEDPIRPVGGSPSETNHDERAWKKPRDDVSIVPRFSQKDRTYSPKRSYSRPSSTSSHCRPRESGTSLSKRSTYGFECLPRPWRSSRRWWICCIHLL